MKKYVLAASVALLSINALASTLAGDVVSISFNPDIYKGSFTVGAGDDLVLTNFHFDLNAGVDGNEFLFTSLPHAGSLAGSTSLTLSGLDFSDGSKLSGFNLLSSSLDNLLISHTANSVTFSYSNGSGVAGPGVVLDGIFATTASVPVPLPGTLPLTLLGLGALGLGLGSRYRKA